MAQVAPENPSTAYLHEMHPITPEQDMVIGMGRTIFTDSITHPSNDLVIAGSCALTEDSGVIADESRQWAEFSASQLAGLANTYSLEALKQLNVPKLSSNQLVKIYRRMNFWKPRSNTEDWHGLETGSLTGGTPKEAAELAYKTVRDNSAEYANSAFEITSRQHIARYGKLASFVWLGARLKRYFVDENGGYDAQACDSFIDELARREPTLPVGVKNDLDGNIDEALARVEKINEIRLGLGRACVAPAVLIYRGGNNAKTAEEWYEEAEKAIIRTRGRVMLDVAHMAEMACHPDGSFTKTVKGQEKALRLAAKLAGKYAFVGVMIETSSLKSPTDPPMRIKQAQQTIRGMLRQSKQRHARIA